MHLFIANMNSFYVFIICHSYVIHKLVAAFTLWFDGVASHAAADPAISECGSTQEKGIAGIRAFQKQ